MESELHRRGPVGTFWRLAWIWCCVLCRLAEAATKESHATLTVSAPHQQLICPVGGTARLNCTQTGAVHTPKDVLKHPWFFTPHIQQQCRERTGPRHTVYGHSHGNHSLPPGMHYGMERGTFWLELKDLTQDDQGRYCCMALDFQKGGTHPVLQQRAHSFIILHITPRHNDSKECTFLDHGVTEASSFSGALATAACIMALLSLPLILLLVYKQRQNAHSRGRSHELVRMDSEAQGHDNPVFLRSPSHPKPRTVSQILSRQASDTGRCLLDDPGTPFSPLGPGDVFFPAHDTIPESPDFMQV